MIGAPGFMCVEIKKFGGKTPKIKDKFMANYNVSTSKIKLSAEQQAAVQSTHGTLVQAAAGAGKTRVLVEHIIFLLEQFARKHVPLDGTKEKFQEELKKYLRSVYVMTFTNAAADEMAVRLEQRMRDMALENYYWPWIQECLGALRISTIHSFFLNIVKRSYFLDFPWSAERLHDRQVEDYVRQRFKDWLWQAKAQLNPAMAGILVGHETKIVAAFTKIFSDAHRRIQWTTSSSSSAPSSPSSMADFWPKLLEVLGLEFLGEGTDLSFMALELKEKKSWALMLREHYQRWAKLVKQGDVQAFTEYLDALKAYKGVRGPKQKNEVGEAYLTALRQTLLKEYLYKYQDDLKAFLSDQASFQQWAWAYQQAFQELENKYPWSLGSSFADIEYVCWRGLQNPAICQLVQQEISYLIMDELQDTSWLQWEIIRLLINDDFKKLFLVGDPQQAIYGFRGGTATVFQDAAHRVQNRLSLAANYRSTPEIIAFNNDFFKFILAKRFSFKDVGDAHQHFLAQTYGKQDGLNSASPAAPPLKPGAYLLLAQQTDEAKLSAEDRKQIEAHLLADFIKQLVAQVDPQEVICVLYPMINPALYLIPLLAGTRLTAKLKVAMAEDPIGGIFKLLAMYMFERQNAQRVEEAVRQKMLARAAAFVGLLMQAYFSFLGIKKEWQAADLARFVQDSELLGVRAAVLKFFQEISLANSNYAANLEDIWPSLGNLPEDWEQIYQLLNAVAEDKVALELNFGGRQIKIMTVHAAKGLEFDHVLLGGIQTNGHSVNEEMFLGTLPGSCQWKNDFLKRERFKSPALILERLASKRKEFSESTRLFYVAATRAIKTLSFVLLKNGQGEYLTHKDDWAQGIAQWLAVEPALAQKHLTVVNFPWPPLEEQHHLRRPFIAQDKLGLWAFNAFRPWGIVSDLSVTRLTSLAVCPRKFYYQNICRINEEDLLAAEDFLGSDFTLARGKAVVDLKPAREESLLQAQLRDEEAAEDAGELFKSSKERGSKIHAEISHWLKSLATHPWQAKYPRGASWEWVAQYLEQYKDNYQFISEEGLRFPLEGIVLSAIPDLVLQPAKFAGGENPVVILDFKTGSGRNSAAYEAQVMAYAYGYYQLGRVKKDAPMQVGLIYLDQQDIKVHPTSWPEVECFWQTLWPQLASLEPRKDACEECSFRIFCP